MARTDTFTGLSEFLAVAELGSFRAAAARLRVTPAAVSQAVRTLETRVGMPLFLRTTRSVAPSEAGARLLSRLRPAAGEIGEALEELNALRSLPVGLLRLSVPRIALDLVVLPALPGFRRAQPGIKVEVDVNDASVDLMESGFDAGIRIGHDIERDMVAVRLTRDFRWCVLGTADYFAAHGRPRVPSDLLAHECIGYRFPSAKTVFRWEFVEKSRAFSVDVASSIIVNDHLSLIALAKSGAGLCYTADLVAAGEIADGTLRPVLRPYLPTTQGLYLYFPRRSQAQPKLRAFIDYVTAMARGRPTLRS
ncbi:MAG: LysR family transcriptional regulator [Alphaproteobacteria bacterium]|nr:LysR family transcriptional regulator [Alphaproteobacteria bacterium]